MNSGILQLSPERGTICADFLRSPAQHNAPDVIDVSFKIRLQRHLGPDSQFLLSLVFGPSANRHLDVVDDNINEASLLHTLSVDVILDNLEGPSKLVSALKEDLPPLVKCTALLHSSIQTESLDGVADILNITARLATTESLAIEPLPVLDYTN